MPSVNPEILGWARQTAGLSIDEAAKRLRLGQAHGLSAVDRLRVIESGAEAPSRAMLAKMSKAYRRPLLTFYLSSPPREGVRGQDFRRFAEETDRSDEALLDALVRDIHARQRVVRAALEDEGEDTTLPWVGSVRVEDGATALLGALRKTLSITPETYRRQKSSGKAFALLRAAAEEAGVFVLLRGNLGSHHSALPPSVFRGFALADSVAPFIVINEQDAVAAWSFTLLHEFVHILLGDTGISAGFGGGRTERMCNRVTSAFLVEPEELTQAFESFRSEDEKLETRIGQFAREYHVSRAMVAYRLYDDGLIGEPTYKRLRESFLRQWMFEQEKRKKERASETGPSYYVVRAQRVGHALLGLTERMMQAGAISTSQAGKLLGVRGIHVHALLAAGKRSGARHSA